MNWPKKTKSAFRPARAPAPVGGTRAACRRICAAGLIALLPLGPGLRAEQPMLTVLGPDQLQAVIARHPGEPALVFTESREFPIRRVEGIPLRWLPQTEAPQASFSGQAQPGEFYVFQVGVYALADTGPLGVQFADLEGKSGAMSARLLRCLSLGGMSEKGERFTKRITVPRGHLQALWIGIDVPPKAKGLYTGTLQIQLSPNQTVPVQVSLSVEGPVAPDHGDDVARNLSRLRWLDSTVGSEPTLTKPFIAVKASGQTIQVLGRELQLAPNGLPGQILSHFSASNTRLEASAREVLAAPMSFVVETSGGAVAWQSSCSRVKHNKLEATWTAQSQAAGLRADMAGRLDYTGSGEVRIHLTAERALDLKDARLEVPFHEAAARYFMGLDHEGGLRPAQVQWKWDVKKHQDCFWLGDVNAGLMLRFKDAEFVRPLVNIYYSFLPLRLPKSWGNDGRGGVDLGAAAGQTVLARAYSGPRALKPGETLDFIFELYLTPFRTLDTEKQWAVRFIHPQALKDPHLLDQAVAESDPKHGPNVINVHQAGYYNPYINYPYSDDSFPAFCDLVRRAHAKGTKLRVYYTTREITQNMPELFALHSMNGEIIFPGPGKEARTLLHPKGPHPWLIENLREDFIPAWVDKVGGKYADLDISVITTPDSRWNNFYLQGLKWLVDKSDFDGIYIDDTALDARSLRRARRILDQRPGRYIDLHSWNHFNEWAGYANNLTIYMEILPYLDRLWLGEGFNAKAAAWDFWLVEMSGLPFGVMSEMLDGADPWRGMVFGETPRLSWSGNPQPLWRVWDKYGIQGTEMCAFFAGNCPVKTGRPDVLATVYRKPGRAFIALGSWAKADTAVSLQIDWKALGLDPAKARLYAPAMDKVQPEQSWKPGEAVPVAAGKGWFLILDEGK